MREIVLCLALAFGACSLGAQNPSPTNLSSVTRSARASQQRFEFKAGDRIVFLGDPWVADEQKECYIETMLTSRLEGKKASFRSLSSSPEPAQGIAKDNFNANFDGL